MTSLETRVVLMANLWPGLQVCRFLAEGPDRLVRLYIDHEDSPYADRIIAASRLPKDKIFCARVIKDAEHVARWSDLDIDFLITVYWPYLLKPEVFGLAKKGCVNFHPALLPINRGWYPHVHSIIDGTPTGVTLHHIDEGADTGPIWVQEEVPLTPYDTAKTIYDRLQRRMVELFKTTWSGIKSGEITFRPQDESKAVLHRKAEIEGMDRIDPDALYTGARLINLLRARSFGDTGFAYYESGGKRVYLNLRLSETRDFSQTEKG